MSDFQYYLDNISKRKLDDEQRSVVFSDKNTVVSAGAGSGKTTVLSYRFLRLIMEEKARVGEILTLTFTRKAAAEMNSRIYQMLSSAKAFSAPVAEAIEEYGEASISTLDSFCSQIVRSDCLRYGVARDFTVISGDEISYNEPEILAGEILTSGKYDEALSVLSRAITPAAIMSDFFLKIPPLVSLLTQPDAEATVAALESDLEKDADAAYNTCCECLKIIAGFEADLNTEKRKAAYAYNKQVVENKIESSLNSNIPKIPELVEAFNLMKSEYARYWQIESLLKALPDEKKVLEMTGDYVRLLQKSKRERGELTFSDVAELAVDILKTNKDIRSFYKQKFRYIMIDEFQDNNKLQKELLYLLSERAELSLDRIPNANELDGEKLFFVGDDKQSIYRFRGADVSVFKALSSEIEEAGGTSLSIGTNYRSEPKVIDHVNSVFEKLFTGKADYDATYRRAMSRSAIEGVKPTFTLCLSSLEDEFENSGEDEDEKLKDALSEATCLADRIKEMCTTDCALIKKKDGSIGRPSYSDIAILLRTTSNQMEVEKALRSRGIPYDVEEAKSLMLEAMAYDFYSFLQYMLYPEDRISLFALARSPFIRLDDQNLDLLKNGLEDGLETATGESKAKIEQFAKALEEARTMASENRLADLADYLFYECGYHAFLLANPQYHAYLENYRTIWEIMRNFEGEGCSLTRVVAYFREHLASVDKLLPTPNWGEDRNAVHIMTIHKSKGLEFPIVIIANAGTKIANPLSAIFKTRYGILADLKGARFSSLAKETEKETAELLRLLYVAATRAESHLIVSGNVKYTKTGDLFADTRKSLLGQYITAVGYDKETDSCARGEVIVDHYGRLYKSDLSLSSVSFDKDAYESWLSLADDSFFAPSMKKVNASALESDGVIENAVALPSIDSDTVIAENHLEAAFGSYCHLLCEKRIKGERDDVSFSDPSLDEKKALSVENDARALVDNLFNNGYFKSLLEKGDAESEVRFFMPYENTVLEGVADLIINTPDYSLIVDYKSDSFFEKSNHKAQVLAYINAFSGLVDKPVYGTLVYLRNVRPELVWDKDGNEVTI